MHKKMARNLLLVFLIAVVAEVTIFQMSYWSMKWQNVETNIQYNMADFEPEGWKTSDNSFISQGNQHFYLRDVNQEIKTIELSANITPSPDYILLFYTTQQEEEFSDENSILIENKTQSKLDEKICSLRLDFSNISGLELTDFTLVINRAEFNFSWSRIIAILMIYLIAKGLFYIQRPTVYQVDCDE